MNNTEREQWIDNDEGLYNWWKGSKNPITDSTGHIIGYKSMSKRAFIQENRAAIDEAIENMTSGKKPQHYLAYGPR